MSERRLRPRLGPLRALLGYRSFLVPNGQVADLLNICRRRGVSYSSPRPSGDSWLIALPYLASRALLSEAERAGITLTPAGEGGIPALVLRHRRRLGLPIALLVSVLLLFLAGRVVWDVRVDGEITLTEGEVVEILEVCGLRVGSPLRSLQVSVIENRALILSDRISWISVNLIGTVANVEIRELDLPPEPEEEPPECANLVSDCGGTVTHMEEVRGNIAVSPGDAISEGQLLVGGIWGDEENGFRYTAASGRVYAECERQLEVSVERKYTKKVYTGQVKYEKYLIFFKNEIKFFSNSGNSPATCDKIDIEEYFYSPSGHRLPVGIRTVRYVEYVSEETERTDSQLAAVAEYRADAETATVLSDGELLGMSQQITLGEDGCTLRRTLRCIRNVAVSRKVEIELFPKQKNKETDRQ